jgi:iron complex transport system ATP-binding protein
VLTLRDVGFSYGARRVLTGVDLSVELGTIVGVVGPNGAGKTTLLRLCAGFLAPDAGAVLVAGEDPRRVARPTLARRLAFLPQEYQIAFPFTVGEVVLMGRYPHRPAFGLETAADVALAAEAMRRCDVERLAGRRFDELSGGERRRALLAQAFCQAAELILLDEPTASLDPAHALAVFRMLEEERAGRGAAALVVTHDLNLAGRFADRLILVAEGRIVAQGDPADVLRSRAAARVFGVELHVGVLPDGTPFVTPLRETP